MEMLRSGGDRPTAEWLDTSAYWARLTSNEPKIIQQLE